MTNFEIVATKSQQCFSLQWSIDPERESFVVEVLAAMREGLEANGFEVEASMNMVTRLTL